MRNFPLFRALVVGILILILQLPIVLIWNLIGERHQRFREAAADVGEKWGGRQAIGGPVLVVPYRKEWLVETGEGRPLQQSKIYAAYFLPERLDAEIDLQCDHLYRGIFEVPVYEMTLEMTGEFKQPKFGERAIDATEVLWDRAVLSLWISDAHSIREEVALEWNQSKSVFQPGSSEWAASPGIHAPIPAALDSDAFPFSFRLRLNGSEGAFLSPVGRRTRVSMKANWPNPSFQGSWLPSTRSVSADGFEAGWDIPAIGRNYPQFWSSESQILESNINQSAFGVDFLSPVDPYRMAERSLKYELLFLFLTFLVVGLIEVLSGRRLHWLQYTLIGAALCLFYLLELSLSEHMGFLPAYLLASVGVVALIATYSRWILASRTQGLAVGGVVAGLYLFLYLLLRNQDYALLAGSVGLFAILALVMYLTRRIDWSEL